MSSVKTQNQNWKFWPSTCLTITPSPIDLKGKIRSKLFRFVHTSQPYSPFHPQKKPSINIYGHKTTTYEFAAYQKLYAMRVRPALAGPWMHRPAVSKYEPWQGQSKVASRGFHFTAHFKWGHKAAPMHNAPMHRWQVAIWDTKDPDSIV